MMKRSLLFLLYLVAPEELACHAEALREGRVVQWEIIIPSYNNEKWCIQNIESVVNQTYPHWHATVIVDCATDNTEDLLREYITTHQLHDKITLQVNKRNKGALANIYYAATACDPEKVIGLLDGDDWFKHDRVLEHVTQVYQEEDVWMTYGQFELWPEDRIGHCRPYPKEIIKNNSFRYVQGVLPSHFRTFYAWLFQLIDKKDLLHKGKFFRVTWDMSIMYPVIEMCGEHHKCISEVLYVYNIANPLNDFKEHTALQAQLDQFIRSKKRYRPLEKKPHLAKAHHEI